MIRSLLTRIARDTRGATIIEFALLAPVIFGMLFGVIQVGVSMQSYNAMRSISSETARFALVEYMKKNEITNADIEAEAVDIASGAPYLMLDNFTASVTDPDVGRVHGAHEKTLSVTYTPPNFLPFFNWVSPQLTFTRPIFVIDE